VIGCLESWGFGLSCLVRDEPFTVPCRSACSSGPETEAMALVASMCAFAATPHTMGAEGEIWCSVQPPDLIRQSCDAFDTLGPPQRLTGRGSVFNSVVDSVGRERRHREWWCHRRQCDKRGVSPNSGTPSCSQNTGSRDPPANIQRLRSPISPMSGDERSVMYPTRSRLVG